MHTLARSTLKTSRARLLRLLLDLDLLDSHVGIHGGRFLKMENAFCQVVSCLKSIANRFSLGWLRPAPCRGRSDRRPTGWWSSAQRVSRQCRRVPFCTAPARNLLLNMFNCLTFVVFYRYCFDGSRFAADGLRRDDLTVGRVTGTVFAQHHVLAAAGRAWCVGERRHTIDVLLGGKEIFVVLFVRCSTIVY